MVLRTEIDVEMAAIERVSAAGEKAKVAFGLTGGIACGKSTVSRVFAGQGVPIVDADVIARKVVEPGTTGLTLLCQEFGRGILTPEGTLDRKRLGAVIFGDKQQRLRLDFTLMPFILEDLLAQVWTLKKAGHDLICLDAPLLIEKDLHEDFHPVVVVHCERDTQLARLMSRNGFTREEALSRIEAQLSGEERLKHADYVIHTDGTLEQSRARSLEVLHEIKNRQSLGLGW